MRDRKVLPLGVFILLIISTQLTHAQNFGTTFASRSDVRLRIMFDNDRNLGVPVSVQLFNSSGAPISEGMSNDRGEISFRSLPPGDYRVKITGQGIKDTDALLVSSEGGLTQFVRVEPKPGQLTSVTPYVSAKQLSVPDKAKKEFDKGTRDLNDSNLGSAKKHLEKATELYPDYAAALNNLGVIAIRENENAKAYDYFQKAVQSDDSYVQALVNLARMEMMNKNLKAALPPLERAKSLAPTDAQVFNMLAVAEVQIGEDDRALANARKVHTLEHVKYAISHYISANILARRGLKEEAISEYQTFLKEDPENSATKSAKAELKQLKNQAVAAK
jgi:tetratricopeptide (TPR) repeat protein